MPLYGGKLYHMINVTEADINDGIVGIAFVSTL